MHIKNKIIEKIQREGPIGFMRDATEFAGILLEPDYLKTEAKIKRIGTINRKELKHAASTVEYYSAPEHHWIESDDAEALPGNLSEQTNEFSLEQPYVASLENARIIGNSGMVVSDGRLVVEPFMANRAVLARKITWSGDAHKLSKINDKNTERTIKTACPLIHWNSPSATGYYGWLCRHLLTLQAIEEWPGETPTLILPANPPKWMVDSIELLGYESDDWIEWDATEGDLLVEELIIPTHRKRERKLSHQVDMMKNHVFKKNYDRDISFQACQWLRSKYKNSINSDSESIHLFISRQNAGSRAVANLDEIMPILNRFGFDIVRLEELPFSTQMKLFLSADAVIGAHGAGLSNTIVSKDIYMLELFGNLIKPSYFIIANVLGHEYSCMKTTENKSGELYVDKELLKNKLENHFSD